MAEERDHPKNDNRSRIVVTAVGLVLASVSLATLALTNDPQQLRLAIVGALWAFLLVAIIGRPRKRALPRDDGDHDELKRFYQLELEQEIAARREYEMRLEVQLRRELDQARSADMAQMRSDLQRLRAELLALPSGSAKRSALMPGGSRPALSASSAGNSSPEGSLDDPLTATFVSESFPSDMYSASPGEEVSARKVTPSEYISGQGRAAQRPTATAPSSSSLPVPATNRSNPVRRRPAAPLAAPRISNNRSPAQDAHPIPGKTYGNVTPAKQDPVGQFDSWLNAFEAARKSRGTTTPAETDNEEETATGRHRRADTSADVLRQR